MSSISYLEVWRMDECDGCRENLLELEAAGMTVNVSIEWS